MDAMAKSPAYAAHAPQTRAVATTYDLFPAFASAINATQLDAKPVPQASLFPGFSSPPAPLAEDSFGSVSSSGSDSEEVCTCKCTKSDLSLALSFQGDSDFSDEDSTSSSDGDNVNTALMNVSGAIAPSHVKVKCIRPAHIIQDSYLPGATTGRESRKRIDMEKRECNKENVQQLLRTTCPCGKDCINRMRGKLDDPFTSVLELRSHRFKMKQKEEKHWWFAQLLGCKSEDCSGKMQFDFRFSGIKICRFAFYEIHGFRGARTRVSSRSKAFETMIIKAGYVHVPDAICSKPVAMKQSIAERWIWRHIKINGMPKPNAVGISGSIYLTHRDVTEIHELYVSDLTKDNNESLEKAYALTYDPFLKLWKKEYAKGWSDEQQHHFNIKTWKIEDRNAMRICRICSDCFEQLVKAKSFHDRELVRQKIARHRQDNDNARKALAWAICEGLTVSTTITIHIDAMDQAKSRVPVTRTHSAGGIVHKLQLKLTGVLVHGGSGKPWWIYMTQPWVKVGANVTLTVFSDLFFKGVLDGTRVLNIGWDGAGDNNCNTCMYYFAYILLVAQANGHPLMKITASRMKSGHTKYDVDQRWSNTSSYFFGNKRNGNRRRDVFTLSEFEAACSAAHNDLQEYVHLRNTINFDDMLQPMRATTEIDTGLKNTYVVELSTDANQLGKVFLRTKERMGLSEPWSDRTVFYPHPSMPAGHTQCLPAHDMILEAANFKQWDINAKNRKTLSRQVGPVEAKRQLPPLYQNWKQKNPKVMKEMTKFAAGGYSCHILTPIQKAELSATLASIPSTPADLPLPLQFKLPNLMTLWRDMAVQPAAEDPPVPEAIEDGSVVLPPHVRQVMRWGLTAEQVTDRALAQNPPPVVEPVADAQEAVAAIEDAIDEVDANPRPQQRQRRNTRSRAKYKVGARVKMHAWRFGEDWNMAEFKSFSRSRILKGTIVSNAGAKKWNILWDYDGETSMQPQKELKLLT